MCEREPAESHTRVGGAVGEATRYSLLGWGDKSVPEEAASITAGTWLAGRATHSRPSSRVESGLGRDARRSRNFSPRSAHRATTHPAPARGERTASGSSERKLRVPIASIPSPPPPPPPPPPLPPAPTRCLPSSPLVVGTRDSQSESEATCDAMTMDPPRRRHPRKRRCAAEGRDRSGGGRGRGDAEELARSPPKSD